MTRDVTWLRDRLDAIEIVCFGGALKALDVEICWMRWRKTKRSLRYGCYRHPVIEITPLFKHNWVPEYVVLSVVHHEGVHAVVGSDHDAAFYLRDSRFPWYMDSEIWLAQYHDHMLQASPPHKPKP